MTGKHEDRSRGTGGGGLLAAAVILLLAVTALLVGMAMSLNSQEPSIQAPGPTPTIQTDDSLVSRLIDRS